ncbi:hypothetical protein ACFLUQ_01460 [Chloroflexota bacterium]
MSDYTVKMIKIPRLQIGNSDVVFHIEDAGDKLGSLRISKGNIVWTPVNKKMSYWLNWNDFGKIIAENGQPGKAHY